MEQDGYSLEGRMLPRRLRPRLYRNYSNAVIPLEKCDCKRWKAPISLIRYGKNKEKTACYYCKDEKDKK